MADYPTVDNRFGFGYCAENFVDLYYTSDCLAVDRRIGYFADNFYHQFGNNPVNFDVDFADNHCDYCIDLDNSLRHYCKMDQLIRIRRVGHIDLQKLMKQILKQLRLITFSSYSPKRKFFGSINAYLYV
jgi:hypothetical protein